MTRQTLVQFFDPPDRPPAADAFSAGEQAVLARINDQVAAQVSLRDILDLVLNETAALSPTDRLGLSFIEDDRHRLRAHLTCARYEPLALDAGYWEDLRHSSLPTVLDRGATRVIHDLERYAAHHPHSRSTALLRTEGVLSSMTCPLRLGNETVGVLFRSARQRHVYDEHQVRLHEAMATRLSQAIGTAYRIEQLARLNRSYMDLLGFVSHELRSPLASVVLDARLLLDGYVGALTPDQQQKIKRMLRRIDGLLNLVGEYLDLARIEDGRLRLSPKADLDFMNDVALPAWELVQAQAERRGMGIDWTCPTARMTLTADPDLLRVVMTNLLSNAVKYGREGGRIRVSTRQADGSLEVVVWNEGPGFPPEALPRLFRKFSRLDTPDFKEIKGTGVGLYSSWRIIRLHGGRMTADARPGHWAAFTFTIPLHAHEATANPVTPTQGDSA